METQFVRDGSRSSLNTRHTARTTHWYKSPSLGAALDNTKYLQQQDVGKYQLGARDNGTRDLQHSSRDQGSRDPHGAQSGHSEAGSSHFRHYRDVTETDQPIRNHNDPFSRPATSYDARQGNDKRGKATDPSPPKPPRGQINTQLEKSPAKGLYRSNSNLDLERSSNNVNHSVQASNLHRTYGSTSSLDLLADGRDKQSFFSIVKNYKTKNDQRSPAPPKIQQVLRGNLSQPSSDKSKRPSNVPIQSGGNTQNDVVDAGHGKKPKTSRHEGPSFFQKLRGVKSSEAPAKSPTDTDESVRRKVFVHYDSQSLTFRLLESSSASNMAAQALGKRRNTITGASAASMLNDESTDDDESTDTGDERSNELVLSCPFFRNEISCKDGVAAPYTWSMHHIDRFVYGNDGRRCYKACRQPITNAVSVLDPSMNSLSGVSGVQIQRHKAFVIEHCDHGASYYRNFFFPYDHHNYFGTDERLGPVAISVRRETTTEKKTGSKPEHRHQYRMIVRTCQLGALRGCVSEDSIPSPSRVSASRGVPIKDIIDFICPELDLSCLRSGDKKVHDQLIRLDEIGLYKSYKVGVLLCRDGQCSEEEMYNNENSTPAFDEFLNLLGRRVRLKGYEGFRGGLDTKTDSTGTHSLVASILDYEIMFHVCTMLPFTPEDRQQLMRKCHVGNDIVTIIFQEPGAQPFSPRTIRSHFQHVFIIVRVNHPCTDRTTYTVAITRSKEVPEFGPPLPQDAVFPKAEEFSDFLLTKIVNAENAVHKSERFTTMSIRTRQEYLRHLVDECADNSPLEHSKSGKFQAGSGRKRDRNKTKAVADYSARGATTWSVQVENPGVGQYLDAILAISETMVLMVSEVDKVCVFALSCESVIGWTVYTNSIRLYYNHGECIVIRTSQADEEISEIISRLCAVSPGAETSEISLQRNSAGQLGFHVQAEGIVSEVDPTGPAWSANLRTNCRIVEVGKFKTASLSLDQLIDILRAAQQIRIITVPPLADGSLRKGCEECRIVFSSQPHYLIPTPGDQLDSKSASSYNASEQSFTSERSDRRYDRSYDSSEIRPSPRDVQSQSDLDLSRESDLARDRRHIDVSRDSPRDVSGRDRSRDVRDHRNEVKPEYRDEKPPLTHRDYHNHRLDVRVRGASPVRARGSSPRLDRNQNYQHREKPSPRDQYLDMHAAGEFRGSQKDIDRSVDIKHADYKPERPERVGELRGSMKNLTVQEPDRGKDRRHIQLESSPRVTRHVLNQNHVTPATSGHVVNHANHVRPTEALRERSFQEELMRLISPDTPTEPRSIAADRAKSEENISKNSSYENEPLRLTKAQRLSPRATSMLKTSQNSVWRRPESSANSMPLLENTNSMDWSNLVDTANKLVSNNDEEIKPREKEETKPKLIQRPDKLSVRAVSTGPNPWRVVGSQQNDLEKRCQDLEAELEHERRERQTLQQQNEQLKRENERLQEESQAAAAQLRKFTQWFFSTMDRQDASTT